MGLYWVWGLPWTLKRYRQVYSGWPQFDSTRISMIWKALSFFSWKKGKMKHGQHFCSLPNTLALLQTLVSCPAVYIGSILTKTELHQWLVWNKVHGKTQFIPITLLSRGQFTLHIFFTNPDTIESGLGFLSYPHRNTGYHTTAYSVCIYFTITGKIWSDSPSSW